MAESMRSNGHPVSGMVVTGLSEELLPGLSAAICILGPGRVEIEPVPEHVLMVQLGGTASVERSIDGHYKRGIQKFGDIDLIPMGSAYWLETETQLKVIRIQITPAFLHVTALRIGGNHASLLINPHIQARDSQIEHLAIVISCAIQEDQGVNNFYGKNLGVALTSRVISKFLIFTENRSTGLSNYQISSVSEYIDKNLGRKISSKELADLLGLSVSYFRVQFSRSFGVSVHQYIIKCRVEKAKTLLQNGKTIAEAASDAGFFDQSHLARQMRVIIGALPRQIIRLRKIRVLN